VSRYGRPRRRPPANRRVSRRCARRSRPAGTRAPTDRTVIGYISHDARHGAVQSVRRSGWSWSRAESARASLHQREITQSWNSNTSLQAGGRRWHRPKAQVFMPRYNAPKANNSKLNASIHAGSIRCDIPTQMAQKHRAGQRRIMDSPALSTARNA
jgi:hypothetical protein